VYNYKDKIKNIQQRNDYMLARTLSMFEYENMPDSIPPLEVEKQLQKQGFTFITEIEGKLYALTGGLGGYPDVYGNPTQIIISNPYIEYNATLDINNDGVLIMNDDMMKGLNPLFEQYNTLLTENEISMYVNLYNTRIQTLISAGDDATRESAEKYLQKVQEGELGVIGENQLFDGIRAQNSSDKSDLTNQLVEFHQYIKASLYNEIGLNSNYNMKRERLISDEVKMNDSLYPLIHNMLSNRKRGIEKVNAMFNHNIDVMFGSIWNIRDVEPEPEQVEPEPEQVEPEPTDEEISNAYAINEQKDDEEGRDNS